jgi:hypothetical protein
VACIISNFSSVLTLAASEQFMRDGIHKSKTGSNQQLDMRGRRIRTKTALLRRRPLQAERVQLQLGPYAQQQSEERL